MMLTNSKGQGQGYAHYDSKYLGNSDRWGKHYYHHQIASHIWVLVCIFTFTLVRSNGQIQCHAHFDNEYLVYGQITSRVWAFY